MSIFSFLGNLAGDVAKVAKPLGPLENIITLMNSRGGTKARMDALRTGATAGALYYGAPFLAHQGASLLSRLGLHIGGAGGAAAGPTSATGAVGPGAGSGMGFINVPGIGTIPDFANMPSGTAAIWGNGGSAGAMAGATNVRGTGVATDGTTAPKPMNPILKSFLDKGMESLFQKPPASNQTFQLPQFGSHGLPGREHVGVLGGGYANG